MTQRSQKVASNVQRIVAAELVNLGDARVSVTAVDVTPDLRQATIWVGFVGEATAAEAALKKLDEARSELQAAVAGSLKSKLTPKIKFKLDTSGEYAESISRLIDKL
jgi:ribosome-binding factor A